MGAPLLLRACWCRWCSGCPDLDWNETVAPVLRAANKKPPGRRRRRLRANAMWRSPSG